MFRRTVFSLLLCGTSVVSASSLHAQLSTIIQRTDKARDSAAIVAAFAKADTGRSMPGYKDLSPYTTPRMCWAAFKRADDKRWRMEIIDTLKRLSSADTMPTAARQLGRSCMASMTPTNVSLLNLNALMQLSVHTGDTAKARAVVDHQLSIATDSRTRGIVLVDFLAELYKARPRQDRLIEEYFNRFDPSDTEGALATLVGYAYLKLLATSRYDLDSVMRLSHASEEVKKTIPHEVRMAKNIPLGSYFIDSIEVVMYKQVPDLPAVVSNLVEQGMFEAPEELRAFAVAKYAMATSIVGQPFRPLTATGWFPDSITTQSLLGKVTLVVNLHGLGDGTIQEDMARYRRLYEQYKDRGFQVILITQTSGFKWGSRPLEPTEEAKAIGWFFREQLKLPFKVVVQETAFRRIADGRRVNDLPALEQQYSDVSDFISGFLVGRDGKVLRFDPRTMPDAGMDAWISRALGETGK